MGGPSWTPAPCHLKCKQVDVSTTLFTVQESFAKVPQEEGTLPGGWPGIYGTDHLNQLAAYRHTLQGALHRLNGDLTQAVVCTPINHPPHSQLCRVPTTPSLPPPRMSTMHVETL